MKNEIPSNEPDVLISPSEARRRLSISSTTEWRLNRSGELSPVFIGGSKRYRESEIQAIIAGEVEVTA